MSPEYSVVFSVLGVFIANSAMIIPLFLWVRSESREDYRHNEAKLDSTRELVRAIHEEVKNFNNRLIEIESKRLGK